MANSFNSVPLYGSNRHAVFAETRNGKNTAQVPQSRVTGTSSAGAITLAGSELYITTESLTTAAAAVYTLTITNSQVNAASQVFASVDAGSSTGTPVIASITPSAGSLVIKVQNIHSATAFNNSIKISVLIR